MTDDERDELIERSLLKGLNDGDEARVQQLRRDDALFRQEYDFQETLIQQVQLKRRQELLTMFARFDAESAADALPEQTTLVVPLLIRTDRELARTGPSVSPLWQQSWFRVAASILLAAVLGAVIWRQLSTYDAQPVADKPADSTNNQVPNDTHRTEPTPPGIPQPMPQGPVAHTPAKPRLLRNAEQVPYYETDDIILGFGKNGSARAYRTVIFRTATEPAYKFEDTLTVYLPALPAARSARSLLYSRANDTYYLTVGKKRYEVVRGLRGKQSLTTVN